MIITCPYCHKELDIMHIEMDKDLRFVFEALPSFGTRYSSLVMGYAYLFGVTPMALKSKKLRIIIEEMKRLFDSQSFGYQKKIYTISHAGIAEALDIMIKRSWADPLDSHNYLKKVMIGISEREGKDASRASEADMKQREDLQRAGLDINAAGNGRDRALQDGPEMKFTREQRESNLTRVRDIIKTIGG